jgi:hypothetical protein
MTGTQEYPRISVPGRDPTVDRKRKLGKGLNALLGETRREEPVDRDDEALGNQPAGALRSIQWPASCPCLVSRARTSTKKRWNSLRNQSAHGV